MTYRIQPGPPSGQHKLGKRRQTLSLAEQLRSVQTSTVCSPIAAAVAGHHEGSGDTSSNPGRD